MTSTYVAPCSSRKGSHKGSTHLCPHCANQRGRQAKRRKRIQLQHQRIDPAPVPDHNWPRAPRAAR
eukprot:8604508-Alexandrium_andersonii.AAC.1